MEFQNIGSHCSVSDCKQLDFLPFKCYACNETFCLEHRTYAAHKCKFADSGDRRALVCPICETPIVPLPNQDPNIVLDDHINKGCAVKAEGHKCNAKGCKKIDAIPNICKLCRRHHCVRHRFDTDHNCPRKPQKNPPPKAPTATNPPPKPSSPPTASVSKSPASASNRNPAPNSNNYPGLASSSNHNSTQRQNNNVPAFTNRLPGQQSQPQPQAPVDATTIGVRLTNGEVLRRTCTASTTLRELQTFIDQNRTDGDGPYEMRTTYPPRNLSYSDLDKTLSELGLIPSGMIILQPFDENATSTTANGTNTGWWGTVSSFFSSFMPTTQQ